ncbi:hypothetical protein ATH84_1004142 [Paracoccus versutus]|uniref:Uncharacterized protein n=1 Tax=Paracoccus versutus TaxID=34007 RepID=A0AAQ0HLE9_PARVE|nr:hypothetical protein ATH84_1004142 [Paracoccus versutus]SFX36212.1 hypothetical protein SAMN04244548_00947 [Paracoccus pantotrophus]
MRERHCGPVPWEGRIPAVTRQSGDLPTTFDQSERVGSGGVATGIGPVSIRSSGLFMM